MEESATILTDIYTTFKYLNTYTVLILILCFVFIMISALISSAEVAFFSIHGKIEEEFKKSRNKNYQLALKLIKNQEKLLATILITNNLINILIVLLFSSISEILFKFKPIKILQYVISVNTLNFIANIIVITFLILLLGEVIPKVYAKNNYKKIINITAFPLHLLNSLFSPFSNLLTRSTSFFRNKFPEDKKTITVDEAANVLKLIKKEPNDENRKILDRAIRFVDTEVRQVMTRRTEVKALPNNISFFSLLEKINNIPFSRIPIYEKNKDNIVGILYIKDLLEHIQRADEFQWKSLIRNCFFVPENKKISVLLEEFKEKKLHMAQVVDEYGGFLGIITLEDIIEEIIGEIKDEFDKEEAIYDKIDNVTYKFKAKISLNDFSKIFEIENAIFDKITENADSLGGFIIEKMNRIPKNGENFKFHKFNFKILSADEIKINEIKVTLLPDEIKE